VVLLSDGSKPECFADAMEDEHRKEWMKTMQEEMDSLHKNHTYELVKQKDFGKQVGLQNQARRAHATSKVQAQACYERIQPKERC